MAPISNSMRVKDFFDKRAEEICLSTRFISLSSKKLHFHSKQELKNDLVKCDDKHPRTISAALNFLQHHILRGYGNNTTQSPLANTSEIMLIKDGDLKPGDAGFVEKVSHTCKQFEEGTCVFKKKHTWKECPSNPWSPNKGESVDTQGVLIMCTVGDVLSFTGMSPDNEVIRMHDDLVDKDHQVVDANTNHSVIVYSSNRRKNTQALIRKMQHELSTIVKRCYRKNLCRICIHGEWTQ